MIRPLNEAGHPLALAFQDFIRAPAFPCVGAKSALGKDRMRFVIGRDIRSAWDDLKIYPNLLDLARSYRAEPELFQSLVVLFEKDADLDEEGFEANLWDRLQSLTRKDEWLGQLPDPRVSDDPDDPHFSLSFGGEGFFVVGLHPRASRPARRFARPALVFNLHDQFEQLRATGRYDKLRSSIIERDVALAGAANPMLHAMGRYRKRGNIAAARWVATGSARSRAGARKMPHRIAPRSGVAFELPRGSLLTVSDPTASRSRTCSRSAMMMPADAAATHSSRRQLSRATRAGICGSVSRARNPMGPLAAAAA